MKARVVAQWFRDPARVAWMALLVALAVGCLTYADRAAAGRSTVERVEAAVADGKSIHWRQVMRVWLPRAAFINGWLMLAAAALVPWARRPVTSLGQAAWDSEAAVGSAPEAPEAVRVRRLGWVGVALLAGMAAWMTAPRLSQSVWGDEGRTLREFLVGQFHTNEQGERTYDEATWGDAFFNFRTPNNHVLYSVVARASHQWLARPPAEATDAYFSEVAIRLPAWMASLGAVFALAGLGATLGWRRAGWVAAALLVLHPGFVRYAAEARGYAFLLLGTPLLLASLVRAVVTGNWRWWWAAAALDFALIYTWPLSVHLVVVANLGALTAIWLNRLRPAVQRTGLTLRLAVTGLVALAAWLQLFLANLIQLRIWLRGSNSKGVAGDGGWIDALSALLTGRVWHEADVNNPLLTSWSRTWDAHAWIVMAAAALVMGSLVVGVMAVWRRSPEARPWLPAFLLPPVMILAQSGMTGSVLYPWYLMGAVPGILLLIAIGLESLAVRAATSPTVQASILGGAVVLSAMMGSRTREILRRHPIEPNREAAMLVQPVINPHHPDYQRGVLTAGFLMRNTIYDPGVREFSSVDQLRALMEEALRTGRDFAITYGQPALARQSFPEIMTLLEDPAIFQPVAVLPGQEVYCTRYIVRHTASPAAE
ncbi:MAG: hypothetical protein ACKV19_05020 [Verrucomicrobiales bacterium]